MQVQLNVDTNQPPLIEGNKEMIVKSQEGAYVYLRFKYQEDLDFALLNYGKFELRAVFELEQLIRYRI